MAVCLQEEVQTRAAPPPPAQSKSQGQPSVSTYFTELKVGL